MLELNKSQNIKIQLSGPNNNISLVEKYFDELVQLDSFDRNKKLSELKNQSILNKDQFDLLIEILNADKKTQLETNLRSFSHNITQDIPSLSDTNKQIGPYLIDKPIGEGGMGQVYLAHRNDGEFNQQVAIKLPLYNIDEQMMVRFENERQILAQLTHPNITHLLDGGTTQNNHPYLVMEYIEGLSIEKYCIKYIPSLNQRINLIIQTCSAVSYAHQKLVLHRDLKPSNILVTKSNQIKLLDFGIAKLFNQDDDRHANKTATQIMTRNYASPEQLQGKTASTQSDLFSLAIIAYEIITGFHPYQHKDIFEREKKLASGQVMSVSHRNKNNNSLYPELTKIPTGKIQGDLENILLKALSVETDKRYISIQEFSNDLENFMANKPVMARKPNKLYQISKWIQRHKSVTILAIFSFISLLITTLYSIEKANIAIKQRQIAVEQKQIAEIETSKARSISDFMNNIFNNATPEVATKELTAKDLLLQAINDIGEKEFEHQETKYKLLALIHQNLITIGKYQESFDVLDNHYQDCTQSLSETNRNCQKILLIKSKIYGIERDYDNCMLVLKKAEKISLNSPIQNKQELFEIFQSIKGIARNQRDKVTYEKYVFKAINLELSSDNHNFRNLFSIYHSLTSFYLYDDRLKEAKNILEKIPQYIEQFPEKEKLQKKINYHSLWANYHAIDHDMHKGFENRNRIMQIYHDNFTLMPQKYGWSALAAALAAKRAGISDQAIDLLNKSHDFYTNSVDENEIMLFRIAIEKILLDFILNKNDKILQQYETVKSFTKNYPKKIGIYDEKLALVEFIVRLQHETVEVLENEINLLHDKLSKKFKNSNITHINWLILNTHVAIKKGNIQQFDKSVTLLEQMITKYPKDNITTKSYVKSLRNQQDIHF